VLYERMK